MNFHNIREKKLKWEAKRGGKKAFKNKRCDKATSARRGKTGEANFHKVNNRRKRMSGKFKEAYEAEGKRHRVFNGLNCRKWHATQEASKQKKLRLKRQQSEISNFYLSRP